MKNCIVLIGIVLATFIALSTAGTTGTDTALTGATETPTTTSNQAGPVTTTGHDHGGASSIVDFRAATLLTAILSALYIYV